MKKIILAIIAVLVIGGGIWFYSMWDTYAPKTYITETPTGTTTVNTVDNTTSTTTPTYTQRDIATHKDAASCYSTISGNVYDLTLWVNMHPGGKAAILSLCGTDGTEKFMNKHHGGAKYMTILARFKIGTLAP